MLKFYIFGDSESDVWFNCELFLLYGNFKFWTKLQINSINQLNENLQTLFKLVISEHAKSNVYFVYKLIFYYLEKPNSMFLIANKWIALCVFCILIFKWKLVEWMPSVASHSGLILDRNLNENTDNLYHVCYWHIEIDLWHSWQCDWLLSASCTILIFVTLQRVKDQYCTSCIVDTQLLLY